MSNKLIALACDDSYCDHVPFKDGDLYDREEVDEFVKELEQQNEALLAQIEEFVACQKKYYGDATGLHLAMITLVAKTPQQSLSSLKSSVVEECADCVLEEADFPIGLISSDKNKMLKRILNNMRKYKEEG